MTPEQAQNAMALVQRASITGAEAPVVTELLMALKRIADGTDVVVTRPAEIEQEPVDEGED